MDLATFDYQYINGVPVISATGEIDLSNIEKLESSLKKANAVAAVAVILSLERVTYFGSTTFHALEKWSGHIGRHHSEFLIVKPNDPVGKSLFDLIHLDGCIRTFDSIEAATERAYQLKSSSDTIS